MKQPLSIITGGLIALCLPLQTYAQSGSPQAQGTSPQTQGQLIPAAPTDEPNAAVQANFGPKAVWDNIDDVKIMNMQGEPLGRIQDLTLDLTNGRVVEILVIYDQHMRMGGKVVAVPPSAIIPDAVNKVYQINMSAEAFKAAPAFDLKKWDESTRPDNVAASYRYFGQEPYFAVSADDQTNNPTLKGLGIVERMSKITEMDVNDLNGKLLGRMQSVVLDVPNGRIINTYISSGLLNTPLKFSTVIPPTLLSFSPKRDHLLLDVTKVQYAHEPHVIFETGAAGQVTGSSEQIAKGPHTDVALVQGTSENDINTTAKIYQGMQTNKLDTMGVQVATLDGRVTLRGSVNNQGIKDGIGDTAITVARVDNVDNQINVSPGSGVFPPDSAPATLPPTQSSL